MFVDEASGTYTGQGCKSPHLHHKHMRVEWLGIGTGLVRLKELPLYGVTLDITVVTPIKVIALDHC